LIRTFTNCPSPHSEVSDFLDEIAEFLYIHGALNFLSYLWVPSDGCVGQSEEFGKHGMFHTALAEIAERLKLKREED
jgi:hypothetical protein